MPPDPSLSARLTQHGQEHLLRWWSDLDEAARDRLTAEVGAIDLAQIDELFHQLVKDEAAPESSKVRPVEVDRLPRTDGERVTRRHAAELGEIALSAGEVAVLIVAGGSGTRLGFEGPKGTYPIGPVSAASLFQIHAEKIVALSNRYGRTIPLYIMTSPENHSTTTQYFEENGNFGLAHVRFFVQGQMPAVDRETGKILLAAKGQVALSPDGHGGTLYALATPEADRPSCLAEMKELGVRTIFYFQVDNPMVRIADPAFLGLHRQADSELSFKVIEKVAPDEKLGVVVKVDGRSRVIEYSDLPAELAELREPDGSLQLWAGSIAVHALERTFIERLVDGDAKLPFHRAFKKVSFVDSNGEISRPDSPNAVKFERFIFDALPMAERSAMVETDRSVEFEPLKNATGPDSPASVRQRMSDQFADWLEAAGAQVTRRSDGSVPFGIEISPLYALDASELKSKLSPGLVVEEPIYLK
ncbi:UTP--glucose-1-phosphate uridylyltransferase [Tundrisphaera lichenicola]|uniref:UTP--glucose-1-phosphate uridylyltransferase n=1 Tax=Tundrisphaera lichenicola TaxID=2029860 RepID=UPI003EBBF20D